MASKSSLQKLQDAVVGTVRGVVKDPVGSAGKAVQQAKGTFVLGRTVAVQVTRSATGRSAPAPAPAPQARPGTKAQTEPAAKAPLVAPPAPEHDVAVTPSDVARVVAKKSPAKKATTNANANKAPAKKAPAKKAASSPSGKLPPRKAPAKKAPAKKSPGDGSG